MVINTPPVRCKRTGTPFIKRGIKNGISFSKTNKQAITSSGFTLLEVLIALVILGIALTVLISSQIVAESVFGRVNRVNEETMLAKNLISNIILNGGIFTLQKKGRIKENKSFSYDETIKSTSYPGIYLIKVIVYKNGESYKNGVVLKTFYG
ncbi:MAG: type IV pilus modification PilV family protein [bacterium]